MKKTNELYLISAVTMVAVAPFLVGELLLLAYRGNLKEILVFIAGSLSSVLIMALWFLRGIVRFEKLNNSYDSRLRPRSFKEFMPYAVSFLASTTAMSMGAVSLVYIDKGSLIYILLLLVMFLMGCFISTKTKAFFLKDF